jgi:hypothetical protein
MGLGAGDQRSGGGMVCARDETPIDREKPAASSLALGWASASTLQFVVFILRLAGAARDPAAIGRAATHSGRRVVFPYSQPDLQLYNACRKRFGADAPDRQPISSAPNVNFTFSIGLSDSPAPSPEHRDGRSATSTAGHRSVLQAPKAFEGDTVVVEGRSTLNVFNGYLLDRRSRPVWRGRTTHSPSADHRVDGTLARLPLSEPTRRSWCSDRQPAAFAPADPTGRMDPLRPGGSGAGINHPAPIARRSRECR